MILKTLLPAILFSIASPSVYSVCSQKNMAGTWHGYSLGSGSGTVEECTMYIDAKGSLQPNSWCKNYNASTNFDTVYITAGAFLVDKKCHVNGSINAENGVTAFLIGELDKSFNSIASITRNDGGNVSLNHYVKQ